MSRETVRSLQATGTAPGQQAIRINQSGITQCGGRPTLVTQIRQPASQGEPLPESLGPRGKSLVAILPAAVATPERPMRVPEVQSSRQSGSGRDASQHSRGSNKRRVGGGFTGARTARISMCSCSPAQQALCYLPAAARHWADCCGGTACSAIWVGIPNMSSADLIAFVGLPSLS